MNIQTSQTLSEEKLNALSHGITAVFAIGGFITLVVLGVQSTKPWTLFSALFYGGSLVT